VVVYRRAIEMIRSNVALASLFVVAVLACPRAASAGARQIHGGPTAGFAMLIGREFAIGGAVGGHLGYGISDAFRVYGSIDLPAGASISDGAFALWPGVAIGVAYSLDNLSVVPWIGLEARMHVPFARSAPGWAVGGGARVGVDWLATRYLGLTVQGSYNAMFFDGGLAHSVTVIAGPRWTVDL
jgi:hypothetical protein